MMSGENSPNIRLPLSEDSAITTSQHESENKLSTERKVRKKA